MASESTPPPPTSGGGNLMYAIIGILLLGGAAALFFGLRSCEEPPPETAAAPEDAGVVERSTRLADDDLVIPEPEPDAGEPEPEPDAGQRVRYVTRYVGGGGGNWDCGGAIDRAAASRALAESNLQFRNCYERRLKVNNQLEGRVVVRMRVSRTGAVDAVQVGGSLGDREVLSCIRGVANRIRFPAPTGGSCAVVEAPFNFSPQR